MSRKEYKLPNGKVAVFEYDIFGIGKITLECMDELMAMIADRPQGKWLDVWQDGICSWRGTCSVCRSTNDIPPPFEAKFCPSCGARMKGADDE